MNDNKHEDKSGSITNITHLCKRKMNHTLTPIQIAADLLSQEEVVAIPTETVYGLAGNMYSKKAVEKIYSLKQRPHSNPLIVHIAGIERLSELVVEIPSSLEVLANKYWPGPLTLLLNKKDSVPENITAGSKRVAVRVPSHPVTSALLKTLGFPLVAPSANPYTHISPTKAEHVRTYFGNELPYILDGGPCEVGLESTIAGMEDGNVVIYRQGILSKEEIERCIGKTELYTSEHNETPTPGLAPRHYAPQTLTLLTEREKIAELYTGNTVVLLFSEPISGIPLSCQYILSPQGSLAQAAKNLYSILHEIDQSGFEKIICERVPENGIGNAINDRLRRAATKI